MQAESGSLIGGQISRIDARQKVTGAARYAAEATLAHTAHAVLLGSKVASGRIKSIITRAAAAAPGVLLVMTHENRGHFAVDGGEQPDKPKAQSMRDEPRPPLEDDGIDYAGQYVAMIVAETPEQARYGASLIDVEYETAAFAVTADDALAVKFPADPDGEKDLQGSRGNPASAWSSAPLRLDLTYRTPNEHPSAMEPHATVASWSGSELTVFDSTQWVQGDQGALAAIFALPVAKVRVVAPFVGGMFGSKVALAGHTVLAALASIRLRRPVKMVLTRQQVLTNVSHRTETVQRFELAAAADGRLEVMRHHTLSHVAVEGRFKEDDEFVEPTVNTSRSLYACANFASTYDLVRLNVMRPRWMRAPGEASCLCALECAMDELAYAAGVDPVELRRRNHAEVNPHSGKPYSSKHLLTCYERGAERFGWGRRNPVPRSHRDGRELIGWGMATATYPGMLFGATARVRLESAPAGVKAVVSTAGSDVGTGLYTVLAIVAAEGLGLPLDRIKVELGDSNLTPCAVAGGSNLTASTTPAVMDACKEIQKQLLVLAAEAGLAKVGEGVDDFVFKGGSMRRRDDAVRSLTFDELLARAERGSLIGEAKTEKIEGENDRFTFQSFGAQFVEVRVLEDIGRIRVSRVVSVFDVGRVMNAKATRSQLIGGIVFGIGQALLEQLIYDGKTGVPVNADLAGYLVPVQADVPDVDVSWIDEPDLEFNSMGCRGVGEIGITGVAAAVANAVFHATGKRIRTLPLSPEAFFV